MKPAIVERSRKAAQRKIPAVKCENCGETKNLQRHHEDITRALDVIVLCQECHKNLHVEKGTWGRRKEG